VSFVRVSAITFTLVALAASAPAAAQVVVRVSPQGQAVPGPYFAALERVRTAAENLRVEAERRGLADVAQAAAQLERIARRGVSGRPRSAGELLRDLDTHYRDLRRRLFAYGNRLDEAFLDVSDELAFQVRMARVDGGNWPGPNPGPLPPPPPPLPPPPPAPPSVASYLFDGALESAAVRFQGTPEQVYAQCVQFIRAMRLTHIDDLRLPGGAAVRNGGSYWSEDAACSIAVLNMQPLNVQAPSTTGRAEDLPFHVTGDLRNIIATYLPRALAGNNFVDDLVIDGRPYRNGGGYWSAAEATQLVLSQLGGVVLPTPPPQPPVPQIRLMVEGNVDGQPFRFAASSAPEVDAMCRNFFATRGLTIARQITLDGQTLVQRGRRPWDVSGACQLITSRARPR